MSSTSAIEFCRVVPVAAIVLVFVGWCIQVLYGNLCFIYIYVLVNVYLFPKFVLSIRCGCRIYAMCVEIASLLVLGVHKCACY